MQLCYVNTVLLQRLFQSMEGIFDRDYDYVGYDDDSGSENADSSEDEIDILLQGTPERKLKLSRRRASSGENRPNENTSSEDDFEKEMNKELDDQVAELEAQRKAQASSQSTSANMANKKQEGDNSRGTENQANYDEVYFDSDEEEMVEGEKRRKKRPVLSNDELLYDPNMDDDDQRWMDNRRKQYQPSSQQTGVSTQKRSKKGLPSSDAVLDCPACMTTLCLDCQRHDVYTHQYRAMFVSHCSVDLQEVLKYPKETSRKKQKKKTRFTASDGSAEGLGTDSTAEFDVYHPVRCTECNTLVAMYDQEEIYHFFNVLSSY
ncbi:E2F-associated phosphoprotein-like [Liolophura sinensis]|uniref:E2F-associated phosphoprotein-like n=1 Tax=Liolophura sinensis TaxID=3198878 RepID=UPI0031583F78